MDRLRDLRATEQMVYELIVKLGPVSTRTLVAKSTFTEATVLQALDGLQLGGYIGKQQTDSPVGPWAGWVAAP